MNKHIEIGIDYRNIKVYRIDKKCRTVAYNGYHYEYEDSNGIGKTRIIIQGKYRGLPVIEISDWALNGCRKSITSVSIPPSIVAIGYCAFYGCALLKSIDIPYSVKHIEHSFGYCTALEAISLPCTFIHIDSQCFEHDDRLQSIAVKFGNSDDWLGTMVKIFGTLIYRFC